MTDILLIVVLALLAAVVALLLVLLRKVSAADASVLVPRLDAFEKAQERTERAVREEVARSRDESGREAREHRQEITEAFKTFGDSVAQRMMDVATLQKAQLDGIRTESNTGARQLREEVVVTLQGITQATTATMGELANVQKAQLEAMSGAIGRLSDSNGEKFEALKLAVEAKLQSLQADNANRLEQMRQTVDEKLQGTLEVRLGAAFKQVNERLAQVHEGLGQMQVLANGVGDLKKVLTNVKTRGTWGEVQLGTLLEQVLTPDQFATNVSTKDAAERVEFAVRLPGQGNDRDETVWLPIDAKFPIEDYQRLIEAQEAGDVERVAVAGKQLENRVRACARDICDKYLNPPKTTDFGILFLPIEGLFAEVIRRPGLTEVIQRECRVVIAGPTTLWSLLSSLQMGFRTLAIQKRSSEVWNLLAAVKTEWGKYGEVLDAVQKKLHQASDTIDKAQVRSRAVGRELKNVQALPLAEAAALLPMDALEDGALAVEDDGAEEDGDSGAGRPVGGEAAS